MNRFEDYLKYVNELKDYFSKPLYFEKSGINKCILSYNDYEIIRVEFNSLDDVVFYVYYMNDYVESRDRIYFQMICNYFKNNKIKFSIRNKTFLKNNQANVELLNQENIYSKYEKKEGNCPDTPEYFFRILNKESSDYRKGILIFFQGKFVGVFKAAPYGNRVLLSCNDWLLKKYFYVELQDIILEKLKHIDFNKQTYYGLGVYNEDEDDDVENWTKVNIDLDTFPIKNYNNYMGSMKLLTDNLKNHHQGFISKLFSKNKDEKVNNFTSYRVMIKLISDLDNEFKNYKGKFDSTINMENLLK